MGFLAGILEVSFNNRSESPLEAYKPGPAAVADPGRGFS